MESTLHNPALTTTKINLKTMTIAYWTVTALFCLEMSFTAYYELLPQGAEAFTRLGFPASYFRMELSLAKLAGVAALLIPMVPARVKEWAYAGFAINLVSALITHLSLGQGPQSWGPSAITSVFWGLSYFFWRRLLSSAGSGSLK
jgi:hypothetical protein